MAQSYIERQIENAIQDSRLDDRVVRIVRGISKLAAKQGGSSTVENYQLLGKRVLAVVSVAAVAVQVVGFVIARKSEEQRIERVVRRVLEEEELKAKAEA